MCRGEQGVGKHALQMLMQRGTLVRAAFGVYRFPKYPVGRYDGYMLAMLGTRVPEACLSHETALDAYGISDVNPNRTHVLGRPRRLRRKGGEDYVIHHEDLAPAQIGWWQDPHGQASDRDRPMHRLQHPHPSAASGHRAWSRRAT